MKASVITRPRWQLKMEQIALSALTACFFTTMISVSLTTIFYLLAFALVLFSGNWRARLQTISTHFAALSFWAIFVLFIIGIFYSTSPAHLIERDLRNQIWLLITPFFIMLIEEDHWRRYMVNTFLIVMTITFSYTFLNVLFHINPVVKMHFVHPYTPNGFIWDHITQSFAMNIAAFICAYRFFFEKQHRIIYALLFILMSIDILFISEGRTGYGIFFLLLTYFCWIRFGWKGILSGAVLTVALVILAFFASESFRTRMIIMHCEYTQYHQMHHANPHRCKYGDYQQLGKTTSVGQRMEMLHIAKIMIHQRPWFGYGTGGIRTAMQKIIPLQDRLLLLKPAIDSVESIYLNFWLQFGVVGLIVFLAAMTLQIKTSFQLPQEYRYLIQVVLIATLFGGLFCSFFNNFPIKHLFALFSALCFSALKQTTENIPLGDRRT